MARPGRASCRPCRGISEDTLRKLMFNFLAAVLILEFLGGINLIVQSSALEVVAPAMPPSQGWRPFHYMASQDKVLIGVSVRPANDQQRQKKLYSSTVALSSAHPPISVPSYSSMPNALDLAIYSSDLSHPFTQHERRLATASPAHVDADPPDAASNSSAAPAGLVQPPVPPHNGCCAPNMVQKRGTEDCHCVYPVRVELFLRNVSLISNWSNEFLQELASQLNLRVSQFEIVNFYVVGASGLNITMDIAPHTGISFAADQVNTMNYSLSQHAVRIDPVLVGDYNLLNLTWFRPLAPAPGQKDTGRLVGIGQKDTGRLVGIACGGVGGLLLVASALFFVWQKSKKRKQSRAPNRKRGKLYFSLCGKTSSSTERNIEALIASHGSLAPKRYEYSEVTKVTSSLNDKLGEGGYGAVFKGRLDDGHLVAVKFLHESKGEGDEFVNEVMSIGRTSHVNIVSLFGFCLEGSKRALIYEYIPNGSLDKYIYAENPKSILGWDKLYSIAIGIARGLEYLHHSCNTRIVHFDIKPQNILLDKDFRPKIADFGLAKLCHTKDSKLSITGARGTVGFIAPEVHSRTFGVVSTKSDVYSYGMMLLEMVGGRKNVNSVAQKSSEKYFPHWIYDHLDQGDGLQACEVSSENEGIAKKMSVIGMWCIQILPMHRPTITKVLEMFERGIDELDMPPRQNFSQILEDPSYNLNAESTSTSSGTKTQVSSEALKMKELSIVNSKSLARLPTL